MIKKSPINTSIFFHNYYGRHEEWVRFFCEKMTMPFTLFYNTVQDSVHNLEDPSLLLKRLQGAASGKWIGGIVLRRSPNQGKDIGGKLVLLDTYLREGPESEYALFLHDKNSPQKAEGLQWKDKLFRIAEPAFIGNALAAFEKDDTIGIIAGTDSVSNEYDPRSQTFISHNSAQLRRLIVDYGIATSDHRYIAGTMFWARTKPLFDFFRSHPPLEIRKDLEYGNVMDESGGSFTHAWERMLTWLIFAQGYKMKAL